jgi:hypothetical protein
LLRSGSIKHWPVRRGCLSLSPLHRGR